MACAASRALPNRPTPGNPAFNANRDLTTDGLNSFSYDSAGRLSNATMGQTDSSPTTRYAHNALGQRVFKTEPVYPAQGTTGSALAAFFAKGWTPLTITAEKLGYAFVYDEDGTLLAEMGTGGANSGGTTQYVYLPTASGPMPVAAVINGVVYAVHSDHLNTPRRITSGSGQVMWQWAYSAFGETAPTTAAKRFAGPETVPTSGTTTATPVTFNLRYPGQYADSETGLFYNANRTYDPRTGRYTQPDPTGLDAGWNLFAYAELNPLLFTDPEGLETIYNVGPVSVVAYPGPPATDYRAEHGSKTGAGHHVHTFIGKHEGPRFLTGSFAVYPGDEKLCAGPFKDALDKLTEGEKQYIKRAQIQVFNDGKLGNRLQNRRLRLTLPRIMSGMPKGRE